MKSKEEVLYHLANNDLVLVDTCFLDVRINRDEFNLGNFVKKANPIHLASKKEKLTAFIEQWRWYRDCLMPNTKFQTTGGVKKELMNYAYLLKLKKASYIRIIEDPEYFSKHSITPDLRERIEESVSLLGASADTIEDFTRSIKIYYGRHVKIKRNIEGASPTDYSLVAAALGYEAIHPRNKTKILTKDHHIQRILEDVLSE